MTERTRLPVVSSAPVTAFVSASITGPDDRVLYFDGNQKIVGRNGGGYNAPTPNAFSLVQIEDCPGSTPTCRASCYVHGLEAAVGDLHALYRHNSRTIREILAADDAGNAWATLAAEWITANAPHGFRWHVSGDLFSSEYASWVATVVERSPTVRHWIYTRSFMLTAVFVGLENITVNYSVDRDNLAAAMPYVAAHAAAGSPVRLCYLVTDDGVTPELPPGSVYFPDYALRGTRGSTPAEIRADSTWWRGLTAEQKRGVCPVDLYGKNEAIRCGLCVRCIAPVTS